MSNKQPQFEPLPRLSMKQRVKDAIYTSARDIWAWIRYDGRDLVKWVTIGLAPIFVVAAWVYTKAWWNGEHSKQEIDANLLVGFAFSTLVAWIWALLQREENKELRGEIKWMKKDRE